MPVRLFTHGICGVMNKGNRIFKGAQPAAVAEMPQRHVCPTSFGQAVYDRRAQLGWSQGDLAERTGLRRADIDRIEEGGATPSLHLLCLLNEAMGDQLTPS